MRLWITILLVTSFLNAGDKIALLIGNNDYAFQPLDNPLHDVDGIYKTLKEIGFDISKKDVLKNASKTTMENALANFAQRATSAEIALVYFSGHGMQVNNRNYMFPAKTTATKPIHLRTLVDLDYFIQSASSAKYGIVLVDACRNNPLVKYFQNGKHKGSTAKKGLGQVTPTTGQVVIGFATSAGDTADDGDGDMSPYAKALSVRLKEPNKDITKVLGLVALDVQKNHDQNPILRTNLAYDVCLYSARKKVNQEPQSPAIVTPIVPSHPSSATSNWITPSNNICRNNGGKINVYCIADWKNATKICKLSGGRLPTIDELEKVITDCGVEIQEDGAQKNSAYQFCCKAEGFLSSTYWSSTPHGKKRWSAWGVFFETAYVSHYTKNYINYVRCIK